MLRCDKVYSPQARQESALPKRGALWAKQGYFNIEPHLLQHCLSNYSRRQRGDGGKSFRKPALRRPGTFPDLALFIYNCKEEPASYFKAVFAVKAEGDRN
jgi:hypothetical protein